MMWSRPCGGAARRPSARMDTAAAAASAGPGLFMGPPSSALLQDGEVGPKEPGDRRLVHVVADGQNDGRGFRLREGLAADDGHGGPDAAIAHGHGVLEDEPRQLALG